MHIVNCGVLECIPARAGRLSDGKYACIIEHSGGMLNRQNVISFGRVRFSNDKFIATISRNEISDRIEACEKLRENISGQYAFETEILASVNEAICSDAYTAKSSSAEMRETILTGNGSVFYGLYGASMIIS